MPAAIGRYQILDRIGQGGMGSLFLALDPMLERQLAIKLLRDDNDELRERFAREARAVARLRHRNIVTIFDVGEQDGHPFIAMEYIQGQTLAELIRAGSLDTSRKLRLVEELCDGLGFAHKAGIVHRDVKPANVMVERDGPVKILDFGIARIAESGMTQAGMLIGTLNYMSPEQVAGRVVDSRSDIFAVGAVLYELLSGRQAFPGGLQNGILNRILHEEPPPLRELLPSIDDEIVDVVERALAKDPQARYQDLAAMRRDLERVRQRSEGVTQPGADAETILIQESARAAQRPKTPRRGADRDELARRRAAQIAAHLETARQAMTAADFESAVRAADEALLLDAEDAASLEILDRARAALDERQVQQLLNRGGDLLRSGALTDALALADEALTLIPDSTTAQAFRQSIERARGERLRERERAEALRAGIQRAQELLEAGAFDQAEAAAAGALRLDPDHAVARAVQRQARLQREELDRRATAAVADAERMFDRGSHEEALAALRRFEPAHELVSSALARLQQEQVRLTRERREAARRATHVAAALAAAGRAPSHEAAIGILEAALSLDPTHAEVNRRLEERRAAWQEEVRQARERREQVAAAIAQAKATASHAEAIATLEGAQTLDPADAEVERLLAERRGVLAREEEPRLRRRSRKRRPRRTTRPRSRSCAAVWHSTMDTRCCASNWRCGNARSSGRRPSCGRPGSGRPKSPRRWRRRGGRRRMRRRSGSSRRRCRSIRRTAR
jgi:serine/threonine-protein kinase